MASASDKATFESETFAPNTFACGTWRGSIIPTQLGIDFDTSESRLHYHTGSSRLHFDTDDSRMHWHT